MNTVKIKQSTDVEKDLTTFTVEGRVKVNDLIQGVENFYQGEYTLNVLVDLALADLSGIEGPQVDQLSLTSKKYAHLRPDGKTAIVISRTVDYGMSRMFEIHTEIRNIPLRYHVFFDIKEAQAWLESKANNT